MAKGIEVNFKASAELRKKISERRASLKIKEILPASYFSDRELVSKIYGQLKKKIHVKRTSNVISKRGTERNAHFSKEQMGGREAVCRQTASPALRKPWP